MAFWRQFFARKNKPKLPEITTEEPQGPPDAVVVTDVLDLHGFFPEQVPEMIEAFLENAQALGLQTLRIIHGKGKSKLKWVVHTELKKYPQVQRFRDAPPELGGWGATLVFLSQNRPEKLEEQ